MSAVKNKRIGGKNVFSDCNYHEALELHGYCSYEEFEIQHLKEGYNIDDIQLLWNRLLTEYEEEKNQLLRNAVEEDQKKQITRERERGFR